jgi:hypothetical protein
MEALARQNSVLMIFEDAHWSDPTTLELFGRVVDRIRTHRVLLLVTFRPDFDPPWVGRPYVTCLAINRLGERESLAIACCLKRFFRCAGHRLILTMLVSILIRRERDARTSDEHVSRFPTGSCRI